MSPEKETALNERMLELGIREEELVEKLVRSDGHGGQNVNKVATCFYYSRGGGVTFAPEILVATEQTDGVIATPLPETDRPGCD